MEGPKIKEDHEIKTLVETIVWIAEKRNTGGCYQNINSAIHSVILDTSLGLQDVMAKNGKKKNDKTCDK